MYALRQKPVTPLGGKTVVPNIMPCRIHHDGPVDISERYWNPELNQGEGEECEIAFFRGRRLKGRRVALPEGYEGVVASKSEEKLREGNAQESRANGYYHNDENNSDDGEEEKEPESLILAAEGRFSEFVVWGHEKVPEDDDPYVKGMQEWMAFASK
ncbi:hypothetical protein KEM55_007374, partial [Ascosphaera atra]